MPATPRSSLKCPRTWCPLGERFNTLSHLTALIACAVGGTWLLRKAIATGSALMAMGTAVFCLSVMALYLSSALFHGSTGARKLSWQRADHACIYLLIAGSHTPFALADPIGLWTWAILAAVWALAVWGGLQALRSNVPPRLPLYMGLGWLGLLGAVPAARNIGHTALFWLIAGGLMYSAGTLFYRQFIRLQHSHGIWHCFVVAGTVSHGVAVSFAVG